MVDQLVWTMRILAVATAIGMVGTVACGDRWRQRVTWFALTVTVGIAFMLSLLLVSEVTR